MTKLNFFINQKKITNMMTEEEKILNELNKDEVFEDILSWMEVHITT